MIRSPVSVLLVSVLALSCSRTLWGQTELASNEAKVDEVFARRIKPDEPGAVCAVVKDGCVIYAKGFGMADLEHNEPLTPDSVFYIASTSKQFTAAGIALLVLDGKLSLATELSTLLPEFTHLPKPVTVDQLVHHTSGMRDYFQLLSFTGWRDVDYFDNDMVVKLLARQRELNYVPGSEFMYSNSNYVLLAEIVKRVSGKSLRIWDEERIFKPLGMTQTHFDDDYRQIVKHRAISYLPNPAGGYYQQLKEFDGYGDGNLLTTVGDLAKWEENFYTGQVGGKAFIDLMLTKGVLANGKEIDYAFGLFPGNYRGLKTVRHGGAFKGFRTELLRFPEQHLSVVVLCNSGSLNPSNLANGVADIYLSGSFSLAESKAQPVSAVEKPKPIDIAPASFDEYVGDYEMVESPGFVFSFTREGDRFYSKATRQGRREIFASSPSEFFHKGGDASFSFHRDVNGVVTHLTLHQYGDHEANRIRPYPLAQSELMDYAGSYYSDELDTSYRVQIEDGKLACLHTRMPRVFLEPRSRDTFVAESVQVVFSRDEKGKVTGLRVSSDRVKNLIFRRQETAL